MVPYARFIACGLFAGCAAPVAPVGAPAPAPDQATWAVQRFTCNPTSVQTELPLRRLSRTQYANTVRDVIIASGVTADDALAIFTALAPLLANDPPDSVVGAPGESHGGFTQLDQTLQQGHIETSFNIAEQLAQALTDSAHLGVVVGACATDDDPSNDAACLQAFINRFGALALRRPLTTDDVAFYASSEAVDRDSVADAIVLLLTAPQFLYFVEEGDPAATGPTPLDAFALASRLSYHFWQTLPDEALFAAARTGALSTPDGYQTQVARLFADPRTQASIEDFFSQWFRLDEVPAMNTRVTDPAFAAFAGNDVPAATLNAAMTREVMDAVTLVSRSGTVSDVLASNAFVARDDGLAHLYQQQAWDGVSTPVAFMQPSRAGLLTRAAFLASGDIRTRPVIKGYEIQNALSCTAVPPPPGGVAAQPPPPSTNQTTREQLEALTEQTGTACAGCHEALLNPPGFATEDFDGLGRYRTRETFYADDGSVLGSKPVSTQVGSIAGIAQLSALLSSTGTFQTCFARQYFRFTFERMEDDVLDGCALADLQTQALVGKPLADVLMAAALRPEFQRRSVQQ